MQTYTFFFHTIDLILFFLHISPYLFIKYVYLPISKLNEQKSNNHVADIIKRIIFAND